SDLDVAVKLEPRQKGLLWYSTYKVAFRGDYEFQNTSGARRSVALSLPFPAAQALYDDLQFAVDGRLVQPVAQKERVYTEVMLDPDQSVKLHVSYQSQGLESWRYSFGPAAANDVNHVSNFHMRLSTDFKDIDFADNSLAPGEKHETPAGWQLDWTYKNLL